jgi:phenylalanyl-tRNA synthetase beta chain
MKLSRKFLNDYLDLENITTDDIATKMVLAGNEYESVSKLVHANLLVVGEVVSCEKHPESTKLSICKVDIKEDIKQIICGASNVAKGQKVIVAKVGAELIGDIKIKEATLAGYTSSGMICSLTELGIDSKYMSEEDKNGIHVLSSDAVVGSDPISYLEFDDEIIDFELTSNRADLLSVHGMAYEVGALFNKKVMIKPPVVKYTDEDVNLELSVKTDKCSMYLGAFAKNITIKESPNFIKARLIASGIRPINNVVDISNYVMLESGQPLHIFDLDKLDKVVVRNALANETIKTLDNVDRALDSQDIVICDSSSPIALAGVMGGFDTEVKEDTKNIFIEAAIFDSSSIRYTSLKTLRSESSNRFEKGLDPNKVKYALNKACELLQLYADAKIVNKVLSYDKTNKEDKTIEISTSQINKVLGMNLSDDEIKKVFELLDFSYELNTVFKVKVPTRRLDINIKEDLIEEIGRIHGYDNLTGKLPVVSIKKGNYTKSASLIKELRKLMSSVSLNQVITYSLLKEEELYKFVLSEKPSVKLLSPMSEDKKVLRQSLLNGLLGVYEYNNARGISDINIFEVGSIYYKEDEYKESPYLSGLLSGNYIYNNWQGINVKADFYVVKGIIENILNYLGLNNRYSFEVNDIPNGYHKASSASIYVDKTLVGHLGKIDPKISKKDIYIFELNLEVLLNINVRSIKFKELSKYPSVTRDMAFVVDNNQSSKMITDIIKKVAGKLLIDQDVFDLYQMNDNKSIAYSITLQDSTKTLTEEEINNVINKIIEEVTNNNLGVLRSK